MTRLRGASRGLTATLGWVPASLAPCAKEGYVPREASERERERERCSGSRHALDADRAAMRLDDRARDREPDPGPALGARRCLPKQSKHIIEVLGLDSGPGVAHP